MTHNLLSNALKFTEVGSVKLEIEAEGPRHKGQLIIRVSDSGIGIAEEKLNNIFESYVQAENDTTARFGGTGLGLSIVKKLVDLMKGQIRVSSEVGKGSVFEITVPAFKEIPKAQNKQSDPLAKLNLQGQKVLVAEDDIVVQLFVKQVLAESGCEVSTAANGQKALELIQQETFDLLLLDMQMPVMDGWQVLDELICMT